MSSKTVSAFQPPFAPLYQTPCFSFNHKLCVYNRKTLQSTPYKTQYSLPSIYMAGQDKNLSPVLKKLVDKIDLSKQEVFETIDAILEGSANSLQIAAFLALLSAKPESSQEIAYTAETLRRKMIPVQLDKDMKVLDIVGTGGDGASTVNISTAASILCAAAGCSVAKHGNRSVSSLSGSADVLEALGIDLYLSPSSVTKPLLEVGITFIFAPNHHPTMKNVAEIRRTLKIRTVFNIIGPLLNPASASHAVIGVWSEVLLKPVAEAVRLLDVNHALVVHADGIDELTNTGVAKVYEVKRGSGISYYELDPEKEFGMKRCRVEDLKGGDAKENAEILKKVLSGDTKGWEAVADAIVLNAAAGIYVYGLESSMKDAVVRAREVLNSGKAADTLKKWAAASQAAKALEAA